MEFEREFERYHRLVESGLRALLTEDVPQRRLYDAMRYSLLAGGKRIRPVLTLAFCRAADGEETDALSAAFGVEALHTYSLIHDDLPCMDNDTLRRGKPTCHVAFGEYTATLAGDALQALAFELVLSAPVSGERRAKAGWELARAAGAAGMCGGQQLDMEGEKASLTMEEITDLHRKKTGALLEAACIMGVLCAGGTEKQISAARDYAAALGLAFQIQDDILDCTADTETLGKTPGSDAASGKSTFAALLGLDGCRRRVEEETARAKAALAGAFSDTGFLCWLADWLAQREK